MKKILAFVLCAVTALSLSACGGSGKTDENPAQIPNPFTECETMEEAVKLVGFDFDVPDAADGREMTAIRAAAEIKLVEVIYGNEDEKIVIRKAEGSEDISGDYTEYPESNSVAVGEIRATVKGENGQGRLAVWTSSGYTYSVGIYAEAGVSADAMADLVAAVR